MKTVPKFLQTIKKHIIIIFKNRSTQMLGLDRFHYSNAEIQRLTCNYDGFQFRLPLHALFFVQHVIAIQ